MASDYDLWRTAGPEDGKVVIGQCEHCQTEFLAHPGQFDDGDTDDFITGKCASCRTSLCDGCPTKLCDSCSDVLCERCARDGAVCAACIWEDAKAQPTDATARLMAVTMDVVVSSLELGR